MDTAKTKGFQPWMAYAVLKTLSQTNNENRLTRKEVVERSGLLDHMSQSQADRVVRLSYNWLIENGHPIVRVPSAGGGTFYARTLDDLESTIAYMKSIRDTTNTEIINLTEIKRRWMENGPPEPWDQPPHTMAAGDELKEEIENANFVAERRQAERERRAARPVSVARTTETRQVSPNSEPSQQPGSLFGSKRIRPSLGASDRSPLWSNPAGKNADDSGMDRSDQETGEG